MPRCTTRYVASVSLMTYSVMIISVVPNKEKVYGRQRFFGGLT
jgi:hypothetical protein